MQTESNIKNSTAGCSREENKAQRIVSHLITLDNGCHALHSRLEEINSSLFGQCPVATADKENVREYTGTIGEIESLLDGLSRSLENIDYKVAELHRELVR